MTASFLYNITDLLNTDVPIAGVSKFNAVHLRFLTEARNELRRVRNPALKFETPHPAKDGFEWVAASFVIEGTDPKKLEFSQPNATRDPNKSNISRPGEVTRTNAVHASKGLGSTWCFMEPLFETLFNNLSPSAVNVAHFLAVKRLDWGERSFFPICLVELQELETRSEASQFSRMNNFVLHPAKDAPQAVPQYLSHCQYQNLNWLASLS